MNYIFYVLPPIGDFLLLVGWYREMGCSRTYIAPPHAHVTHFPACRPHIMKLDSSIAMAHLPAEASVNPTSVFVLLTEILEYGGRK